MSTGKPRLRVHRVPHSTNVERIAIACGIKGVAVEWVDHDPADRLPIVELSGQELVPVAELASEVIVDSVAILRRIEKEWIDPPLWPVRPDARARSEIFIDWFNGRWKIAPNALAAPAGHAPAQLKALAVELDRSGEWFERMLGGPLYLSGMRPGIEDVIAYPFLRYAADEPAADDTDPFHAVLHDHLRPNTGQAVSRWIERMRELPRA